MRSASDIPGYDEMIEYISKQEPDPIMKKAINIIKSRIDFWSSINN